MKKTALFVALLAGLSIHAQLEVLRVIPNKINYRLDEDAVISVTIANRGTASETAELQVHDCWDLAQRALISKRQIQLEGGKEETFRIPWNSGNVRYGHETRATLTRDGKVLSAKSEFFNVINEWGRVNIGVWPQVIGGTPQGDRLCKWYGLKPYNTPFDRFYFKAWGKSPIGPFASYFTNFTPWNMSFSTFGVHYDPSFKDDELWQAVAEGSEGRKYSWFRKETEFCRKWGVHRTMYLAQKITGNPGFELLRKHPQWFFKSYTGDFKYAGPLDPVGLAKSPRHPYFAGWSHVMPTMNIPEVLKFGMDTALDGVLKLGFDGIYFDGIYSCRDGYDHLGNYEKKVFDVDVQNRKISDYIVKRFQQFRREKMPNFYYWANGTPGPKSSFTGFSLLADPQCGTLWEAGEMPLNGAIDYLNVWSSLKETTVKVRNDVWHRPNKHGVQTNTIHIGYTQFPDGLWMYGPSAVSWGRKGLKFKNFLKTNQFWCMNSHMAAIIAGVCAHPYALQGAAYRPFTQIMTRYSDFYWHEDIKIVPKAFKKFNQDSLRDIWWDDYVYTRETPDHRDYYIHLLNAPDVKRLTFQVVKETNLAKDVEISTELFKDRSKVQAWTIQPYGSEDTVLEPKVTKLSLEDIDGETVMAIPPFRYYTLLVIRERK